MPSPSVGVGDTTNMAHFDAVRRGRPFHRLRTAHEARTVERQPQGEQRAIRAFLLGMAACGLGLGGRLAFEEGVGHTGRTASPSGVGGRIGPTPARTDVPRSPRATPAGHRRRDTSASCSSARSPRREARPAPNARTASAPWRARTPVPPCARQSSPTRCVAFRPSSSMAHSPAFSTPTERGQTNARVLTSTL